MPCPQLKILAPSKLCGAVIGKEGRNIQNFKDDSKCEIRVQVRRFGYCAGVACEWIVAVRVYGGAAQYVQLEDDQGERRRPTLQLLAAVVAASIVYAYNRAGDVC